MTEQELRLIRLKSNIDVNQAALALAKRTMRDLQLRADEPAVYADSIFSGVDVLRELALCADHIKHLCRQIKRDEKEIFKYKLHHGEMEI